MVTAQKKKIVSFGKYKEVTVSFFSEKKCKIVPSWKFIYLYIMFTMWRGSTERITIIQVAKSDFIQILFLVHEAKFQIPTENTRFKKAI